MERRSMEQNKKAKLPPGAATWVAGRTGGETQACYQVILGVHPTPLSRLLFSKQIMMDITDIQIHPITSIDHEPVSISLTQKRVEPPITNWKVDKSLVKEQDCINYFKSQWAMQLEDNKLPGISTCVPWKSKKKKKKCLTLSKQNKKTTCENKKMNFIRNCPYCLATRT